jgi:carbon catabolite-derepressing protein kinase
LTLFSRRHANIVEFEAAYGNANDNPYFATSPPNAVHEENMGSVDAALNAMSIKDADPDSAASPLADSSRSITSTIASTSARGYVSKVGILPTSLPALHKEYLDRQNAGIEEPLNALPVPDIPLQPRTFAEQQEAVRRLKPHSKSAVKLDDSQARPQAMTPVATKKTRPIRWQFGIRSRNAPWEALLCIYKALAKLKATWVIDEEYDKVNVPESEQYVHATKRSSSIILILSRDGFSRKERAPNPYEGLKIEDIDMKTFDPIKYYRLPADPWHIVCRWRKDGNILLLRALFDRH